jgi:hypothetical protein
MRLFYTHNILFKKNIRLCSVHIVLFGVFQHYFHKIRKNQRNITKNRVLKIVLSLPCSTPVSEPEPHRVLALILDYKNNAKTLSAFQYFSIFKSQRPF